MPHSRLVTPIAFTFLAVSLASGCVIRSSSGDDDGSGGAGAASAVGGGSATGGAGGEGAASGGGGAGAGGGTAGTWSVYTHPCPGGSRTDALHRDDDGTLWVGCGTNQVGYGLFHSSDGGESWSEADVTPSDKLTQYRVSSISRGHDDALYVAGINANNGDMVVRLDTGATPFAASSALVAGNQVGQSFHAGTFRSLSDGRALAESLTGHDMLFRPTAATGADAASWVDTYGWAQSPPSYQILDLTVHDDAFYGCGSTIAEPPFVFLPPRDAMAEPYEMEVVELPNSGWTGEMWGLAASADRVVVVGVDQQNDVGKIYVSGEDPYEPGDYLEHAIDDIVGADSLGTWGRGVCMRGDRVVVVGERQPLGSGTGLVLLSDDGGQTFTNETPEGVTESVSKCVVRPDGGVVVAGAAGFVGVYD